MLYDMYLSILEKMADFDSGPFHVLLGNQFFIDRLRANSAISYNAKTLDLTGLRYK